MTCRHGYIGACAVCDGAGQVPQRDTHYMIKAGDYGLCTDGKWRHAGFADNLKVFGSRSSAAEEIRKHHTSVRMEIVIA